eukprot:5480934-Amphidinium_carterae.1
MGNVSVFEENDCSERSEQHVVFGTAWVTVLVLLNGFVLEASFKRRAPEVLLEIGMHSEAVQ